MTLIGIVGGVEIAVLFVAVMIGYIVYAVGREKSRNDLGGDTEKKAEIQ